MTPELLFQYIFAVGGALIFLVVVAFVTAKVVAFFFAF